MSRFLMIIMGAFLLTTLDMGAIVEASARGRFDMKSVIRKTVNQSINQCSEYYNVRPASSEGRLAKTKLAHFPFVTLEIA
ncbi:hypothetical protein R1flu_024030 [Riccia fluitans]|uniref:Uncharacterized protein n=1 Tax=Riccia fluitans TaxID=41844 RepID=A0ABD1XTP8_9MARC